MPPAPPLLDIPSIMGALAREYPVFSDEKEFERAFARKIAWPRASSRTLPEILGPRRAVDLAFKVPHKGTLSLVELKFARVAATYMVGGNRFDIRASNSSLPGKLACLNDLSRLEKIKSLRDGIEAHFVMLSNDRSFWESDSADCMPREEDWFVRGADEQTWRTWAYLWWHTFRDGATIAYESPPITWNDQEIEVVGPYSVKWHDYSRPAGGPALRYAYFFVG